MIERQLPSGEFVKDTGTGSSFLRLAQTCEMIRSTTGRLKKIRFLSDFLLELKDDEEISITCTFLSGRIFPPGSEIGGEVNVGYSLIWNTFANWLGVDESALSQYYMKHGDLGSALEDALRSGPERPGAFTPLFSSTLSIKDVYSAFKELARATGKGFQEWKRQILERVFASLQDPIEAKYLVRILTREMRIGLVEGLVEESIAIAFGKTLEEIRTSNLVTGSIGLVAVLARDNKLSEARLTPGRPTNFMLAEPAETAEALHKKFEKMPVLSEFKYDGIRAQAHLFDSRVAIFSRNLEDVTRFFPEIEARLTKFEGPDLILDGEIIASKEGTPLSFQLLQRRLRKIERLANEVPVRYLIFDLLFFEKSIIDVPLSERVKRLRTLKFGEDRVVSFSEQRPVQSPEEIVQMFQESKNLGFEGLVVKDPASKYTPGRRGANWVKLKKELDTLDVVIVAAEYGHGKRAGVISDYTFAVRDDADLKVIGKAYSGLTDKEIDELTKTLKLITLKDYGYRRTVKPQIVLEVAFDAIQMSGRHGSGYALRFPRIKRIRTDKSVDQIDSLERVKGIYESQIVKA